MSFDIDATSSDSYPICGISRVHIDAREVFGAGHLHLGMSCEFLDFHVEDVTVGENLVSKLLPIFEFKWVLDEGVHASHD